MLLPNPPDKTFSSTVIIFFAFFIHLVSARVSIGLIVGKWITPERTLYSLSSFFDALSAILVAIPVDKNK